MLGQDLNGLLSSDKRNIGLFAMVDSDMSRGSGPLE